MNRLVLIGNGFDLAHGLKTSYKDFICWYWYKWGEKLLSSHNKKESDGLCSFTLNESIEVAGWYLVWSYKYSHLKKNPLEPFNPIEIVGTALRDRDLCEFTFMSPLLQRIWEQFMLGWVDIENEYFSLLTKRVIPINPYTDKDIKDLNDQLNIIRSKLIEYLRAEEKKGAPKSCLIKDIIYRPIEKREISVAYKSLVSEAQEASSIMLLNFNYTNTPEQYVTDASRVIVNYIHGKLEDPKSVIFGYGDELDADYKRLQNLNENECLRHIKSIRYLESENYRKLLEFIESEPYQIIIMGHSCGNSDRTLLNTLFEHRNCVSIKPYYHIKEDKTDNYLDIVQNISRNFNDMKLMRDRAVNKTYCETLTQTR